MDALTSGVGKKRESEREVAAQVQTILSQALAPEYDVACGRNLLYKIQVDATGKLSAGDADAPMRGQYAFQTDVLVERRGTSIPLVVIELKSGSFSSHDIIVYNAKANRHKVVYPFLRYGFVVVGVDALGRRFVTHNEAFDFAMAIPKLTSNAGDLIELMKRQIASAEELLKLSRSNRLQLRSYEETVQIDR